MARLPIPGGDGNNWGTTLNDFLQQALAADGTLVTSANNSYTGLANTNLANSARPGLVQLVGDFGGIAASPQTTGLRGRTVSSTAPNDGDVLTWSAGGNSWAPQAPSGGTGTGVLSGNIDGGSAASAYSTTAVIDCGGA